jgi:hypothetical protein
MAKVDVCNMCELNCSEKNCQNSTSQRRSIPETGVPDKYYVVNTTLRLPLAQCHRGSRKDDPKDSMIPCENNNTP